jgi:hypothetical protein
MYIRLFSQKTKFLNIQVVNVGAFIWGGDFPVLQLLGMGHFWLSSSSFWDVMLCNLLKVHLCIGGTCHLQNVGWLSRDYTSLYPKQRSRQNYSCENLKSHKEKNVHNT